MLIGISGVKINLFLFSFHNFALLINKKQNYEERFILFSGMSLFARNCIDEEHLVNIEVSKNKKENVTPRDIFIPPLGCYLYNGAICNKLRF